MDKSGGERAYYDELWRQKGGRLEEDPKFREKVGIIREMIPADVETILDVGCGDGSLTNHLGTPYRTTGLDTSEVGLRHLRPPIIAVQASVADLPFADASYDLVLSSELLEHLDGPTFERAVKEIARVAKRYVLISVPNNENLRKRITRCPECRHEYHLYCHHRSFSESSLPGYFHDFHPMETRKCGHLERPSLNLFCAARQRLLGIFFYVSSVGLKCPKCGTLVNPPRSNTARRSAGRLLEIGERLFTLLLGIRAEPDWLIALLEKNSSRRIA